MLDVIKAYWWIFLILAIVIWVTIAYQRQKKFAEKMRTQTSDKQAKITVGTKVILDSGMHGTIRQIKSQSYMIEIAPDVCVEFEKYGVIFTDRTQPDASAHPDRK